MPDYALGIPEDAAREVVSLRAENERLRNRLRYEMEANDRHRQKADSLTEAILDIDAHATPLGEDADGFVSTGYVVSVGSLHRALGVVGHTARRLVGEGDEAKCRIM